MRRPDMGSIYAAVIIGVLACGSFFFKNEAMNFMRLILEKDYLNSCLILVILIIVVTHAIKVKPQKTSEKTLIRSGFIPLDIFLTLGTYIAVTKTACSLLEGAFIQNFYDVVYFTRFSSLDIYVLLGVSAFLIWYVLLDIYKLSIELFFPLETPKLSDASKHNPNLGKSTS